MTEEEREKDLHNKSKILQDSVQWWEAELEKTMYDLEEMESLGCSESEIEPVIDKLKYLFIKAGFERREMNKIESQVNHFLINQSNSCRRRRLRHRSFSEKRDEQ